VSLVSDCIGEPVKTAVSAMKNGDVVLLENVRFYPEEEKNDKAFAEKLAANADVFVNDAFGTAHRAHGSTEGVTAFLKPSVAGKNMYAPLSVHVLIYASVAGEETYIHLYL
jgi:phosphoglycerate kinase